ncbi:MAG: hypothetical protein WC197_01780 [Candidatus Gastranaerophilaceae bacterium]|jgi:tetratricopeptide (TPR) repeat protein
MKKIFISLISFFIIASSVLAADAIKNPLLKNAIYQYKHGNYTGSFQTIQGVIEKDPSDTLAHYYLAITLVKLGQTDIAKAEYNKVIQLNTSSQLTNYAKAGITCIDDPNACSSTLTALTAPKTAPSSSLPSVPVSASTTNPSLPSRPNDVNNFMEQKKLDNIKEMVNTGKSVNKDKVQNFDDFSKYKNRSAKPTNDEIVNAMEVLKNAGFSNFSTPSLNSNPEAMQMNMLMSSMGGMNGGGMNNNNNAMNMLPFLMAQQQDGKNIDPKLIQSMMMSSMMPSMSGFDTNNSQY